MSTPTSTHEPQQGPPTAPRSWAGRKPGMPSRVAAGTGRRRRVPYLVLGVLLIVVCAAGTVVTVLQVGQREPMLSLARPVTVGHVLTPQDLRQVPLSADSGTDVVPASQASSVLGQPVAYSLPSGTLLPRSALGHPQVPPPGQGTVAVAVKAGQVPPDIAPGTTVSVIVTSGAGASSSTGSTQSTPSSGPWSAVVTSVAPQTNDQSTVVSLQLPTVNARQVAAIPPGQLALVAVPPGGQ
ncbi:flagellar biosynthesis protein FlgA [Amycolatopsis sp. K13G38]|uniref:Flagellar biosynthesis protein FlgA n=2 Tax=Amycolatopsis acididurans TaxID=2724524 RepID=A0ABX1JAJ8_9PSEU|nr:flagellar biosynthesis protein FlgA [Amycolatopsis acididurans]